VTGATGGIGSALVPALVSAGHRVIAVGRDVNNRCPDSLQSQPGHDLRLEY
jgi:uncharacterized protein YbjT (DUF2867 family)